MLLNLNPSIWSHPEERTGFRVFTYLFQRERSSLSLQACLFTQMPVKLYLWGCLLLNTQSEWNRTARAVAGLRTKSKKKNGSQCLVLRWVLINCFWDGGLKKQKRQEKKKQAYICGWAWDEFWCFGAYVVISVLYNDVWLRVCVVFACVWQWDTSCEICPAWVVLLSRSLLSRVFCFSNCRTLLARWTLNTHTPTHTCNHLIHL